MDRDQIFKLVQTAVSSVQWVQATFFDSKAGTQADKRRATENTIDRLIDLEESFFDLLDNDQESYVKNTLVPFVVDQVYVAIEQGTRLEKEAVEIIAESTLKKSESRGSNLG